MGEDAKAELQKSSAPWLSVLMPVYNGAKTLSETLQSLVGQADGVEVILIDQGSSDESANIARGFSEALDIQVIPAPQNENWVQNTNQALTLARAPRSTLLHQDDIWAPNRTAVLKKLFADYPEASLWVHGSNYIDALGECVGSLAPAFGDTAAKLSSEEALATLIVQNTIALPAAAFPTDLARDLGGLDETLWYTADWNLWLGLASKGSIGWSPERAASFRLHSGSLTISGSKDLDDFATQLAIPVERYRSALPKSEELRAIRKAELSNTLNVWLASVFNGARRPVLPVVSGFWRVGPLGWPRFFAESRIWSRTMPRLRLKLGRRLLRHE